MSPEMSAAITFIQSLKIGERVKVTRDGRTNEMFVSSGPTRCDGPYGSYESMGVTVTFGPGRYSTRVQADHLVRTRRGHGFIGGGTTMERLSAESEAPSLF
ncbi:hypothetical protein [Streptomyces sp. NBC_00239]|uniref:hypothetical protein n=1 Tax=Streptomyces sp. NBC_00239 TaxID=2903640 RepID=UPI002E2A4242|nr:hypothetical protein [Streptomyces sp. NBC_00239]